MQGLGPSRFGRGWRRQPSEAGTPFEIEQQAERQGREYGRRRHPGGIKQVGDPVIADVEEMKGAVGAKEQTHPIEAAPELFRHEAALAAGECGVKHVCQPRKARIADRTRSELANIARGSPLTPTTCSTEGLPGRNSARIASAIVTDSAVGTSR